MVIAFDMPFTDIFSNALAKVTIMEAICFLYRSVDWNADEHCDLEHYRRRRGKIWSDSSNE
jgi:hypothetical protein